MQLLRVGSKIEAIQILKRALELTSDERLIEDLEQRLRIRATTLNNLACAYESRGALHDARRSLYRALAIETDLEECDNPAGTFLNLSAVLSQLGEHEAALVEAQRGLQCLKDSAGSDYDRMLPIAYQNVGVELEYLGSFQQALVMFAHGAATAERTLGQSNSVSVALRQSAADATEALATRLSLIHISEPTRPY
eukprot:TRINITY_DN16040_c0_g1_i5.p1 TRINITY_DN16040_c0_g1~~TRINITY_DN16040_c0_g1_i5.p1  ORF type:complete len:195 (+),score=37.82 TRINITY_DN16040_c0_g1_i5:278-862(+)